MSRFKASAIHLGLSALAVGSVLSIVMLIWYPGATFQIAGAWSIVLMLVAVDLVLGPTLTLIVYKEGKPGLKFDLAVIVTVQIIAMMYGAFTLYSERPGYLVFAVDRFALVSARHIDTSAIRYDELQPGYGHGVRRVFARKPQDPEAFQKYMESVMFQGKPDLEERPEFWEPYANGIDDVLAVVRPLTDLPVTSRSDERRIKAAVDEWSSEHPNLGFVPIGSHDRDIGMLMDMDTAEPLAVLNVNPWIEESPDTERPAGEDNAHASNGQ